MQAQLAARAQRLQAGAAQDGDREGFLVEFQWSRDDSRWFPIHHVASTIGPIGHLAGKGDPRDDVDDWGHRWPTTMTQRSMPVSVPSYRLRTLGQQPSIGR